MNGHSASQEPTKTASERRDELTADDVFEVLGNRRRRYVFHHLKRQAGREVSLHELTDTVAAWEADVPISDVDRRTHNSVRTALRQSHLPMMDECGVVDYDEDDGTVTLAPAAADLDVSLDVAGQRDVPWSLYYLGLSVLFGLLVVTAFAGIPPFGAIGEIVVTGCFLVTFAVSALVHTYVGDTEMRLGGDDDPPEVGQR